MTPEALRDYLITRRVDEDVVQDVLVDYLAAPPGSIRYPKSWAWRAAQNQAKDRAKYDNRRLPDNRPFLQMPSHEPSALRVAAGKQELARAFKQGPYKRRVGHYKDAKVDYRVLQKHNL